MVHAQSSDAAAMARQLMVRSGMSVQLRGFTAQIEGETKKNAANLDDKMVNALVASGKDAFRPDLLEADIGGRLAKKLTVGDMKGALAWLETDTGRRVTQAEELSSETIDEGRLHEYAETLKAKPLGPKRTKLITEVISASNAVRAYAATMEAITLGVAIGLDTLQPVDRRQGEARLRGKMLELMPPDKVKAGLTQQLPIVFALMYRDISDADLVSYVAFLKSVAGKRYQAGMTGAFTEGVRQASIRVGELVGQRQRNPAM
jgi:hypothetical protein